MPGISGGLTSGGSRPRRVDTPDVLDSFAGVAYDPDPDPAEVGAQSSAGAAQGSTRGQVIVKLEYNGRVASVCLQNALLPGQFEKLACAALQIQRPHDVEVVGVEAKGGVVVPVTLISRSPHILAASGGLRFKLLLRSKQQRQAAKRGGRNAAEPPLTHRGRVQKIVEFAAILQAHDYLSTQDVSRIERVLSRHADLAWYVVRVYSSDPDSNRLLNILRNFAALDDEGIQLIRDIMEVTNTLAGDDGAGFSNATMLNLFYLILVGNPQVRHAFTVRRRLVLWLWRRETCLWNLETLRYRNIAH